MRIIFSEHARDEYPYWQCTDGKVQQRVNSLIKDIQRTPFEGVGKPEPLQHALSGYWSHASPMSIE